MINTYEHLYLLYYPSYLLPTQHSKRLLGHKKTHTEICHLAKIDSAEHLLLQQQLCCHTYAIKSTSSSSVLWWTTRSIWTQTSWTAEAVILWSHQVDAQEMQYSWIRPQESIADDRESWSSTCATGIVAGTGGASGAVAPNKIIGEQLVHAAPTFFCNLQLKVTLQTVMLF